MNLQELSEKFIIDYQLQNFTKYVKNVEENIRTQTTGKFDKLVTTLGCKNRSGRNNDELFSEAVFFSQLSSSNILNKFAAYCYNGRIVDEEHLQRLRTNCKNLFDFKYNTEQNPVFLHIDRFNRAQRNALIIEGNIPNSIKKAYKEFRFPPEMSG